MVFHTGLWIGSPGAMVQIIGNKKRPRIKVLQRPKAEQRRAGKEAEMDRPLGGKRARRR